jgi:hypothetical protein
MDHDGYYLDGALGPEILYHHLLDCDGYCHYDRRFFMLFQTMVDIIKFYGLWPKILYHRFLGHDGYAISQRLWLVIFCAILDRDRYYHFPRIMTKDSFLSFPRLWQVYVTLCSSMSLTFLHLTFIIYYQVTTRKTFKNNMIILFDKLDL